MRDLIKHFGNRHGSHYNGCGIVQPMLKKPLLFLFLSLGLFAAVWLNSGFSQSTATPTRKPNKSTDFKSYPAPLFTLKTLDGKKVTLEDFKGKVIILDFWATWCPPCIAEIPHFIELQKKYGKEGVQFLGISLDQDPKAVQDFYKKNKMNYPVMMGDAKIAKLYGGVQAIPTTFFIDRNLQVVDKIVGFRPPEVFEEKISRLKF